MAAEQPTAKSQLHSRPASFAPFTSEQKELETAYFGALPEVVINEYST